MQTTFASSRVAPAGRAARAARRQQQLVAFQGFRSGTSAVERLGHSGSQTLQQAVQRHVQAAASSSGVKVMRVTRMMFERFTEKAIKASGLARSCGSPLAAPQGPPGTRAPSAEPWDCCKACAGWLAGRDGGSATGRRLRVPAGAGPHCCPLSRCCLQVVMLAQEEARRLGHNFVGTEQILLGLIGESTGAC